MLLFVLSITSFRKNTAYMIKVVGDERYVVKTNGSMRVVSASNLQDVPEAVYAAEMIETAHNTYAIKFCDEFMSSKSSDPGIIAAGAEAWEILPSSEGFKLLTLEYGQCLTAMGGYHGQTSGNYINRSDCNNSAPQTFQFYEMGDVDFYCKTTKSEICDKLGFDLASAALANRFDSHVNNEANKLLAGLLSRF